MAVSCPIPLFSIEVILSIHSQDGRTLFDQELYTGFAINTSRPFFLTFAGDVSVYFCFFKPFTQGGTVCPCAELDSELRS